MFKQKIGYILCNERSDFKKLRQMKLLSEGHEATKAARNPSSFIACNLKSFNERHRNPCLADDLNLWRKEREWKSKWQSKWIYHDDDDDDDDNDRDELLN